MRKIASLMVLFGGFVLWPAQRGTCAAGQAPEMTAANAKNPPVTAAATHPELDRLELAETAMVVKFTNKELEKILKSVAQLNGITVAFAADFTPGRRISVDWQGVPIKQALAELADANGVRYEVTDPKTLTVHDAKKNLK